METQHIFMRIMVIMVVISVNWTTCADFPKKNTCCTSVTEREVTDPIISYRLQNHNLPCVRAVILETQKGNFCIRPRAPWLRQKLIQFKRAQKDKLIPSGPSDI